MFRQDKDPEERAFTQGVHGRILGIGSESHGANPFLMQADYLAHAFVKRVSGEVALGPNLQPGTGGEIASVPKGADAFVVRRALIGYKANDGLEFELGRDFAVAGLNIPDHTSYLRARARRNVLDYPTQLRALVLLDQVQILPYLSGPSFEETGSNREYGAGTRAEYALSEKNSIGAIAYFGDSPSLSRLNLGLFGRLSQAPWNGLLVETGYSFRKPHDQDSGFGQSVFYAKPYIAYLQWAELGLVLERLSVGAPFEEKATRFGPSLNLRLHEYVSLIGDGRNTLKREQSQWSWYGQVFVHVQI
jgi:hypothetical protein